MEQVNWFIGAFEGGKLDAGGSGQWSKLVGS